MKTTRPFLCALAAALALATASCGDSTPAGPASIGTPQPALIGSLVQRLGLLKCTPLPYDSVTQTVGWDGGIIHVGPHTLSIPAGALRAPVTITAVVRSDTVNAVRFGPEGLTFQQPASLTMSYGNCSLVTWLLPKRIAYASDDLKILEYLPSLDILSLKRVTGSLQHFSVYAVAW
ncbi:MAG TPA: hypothetical protein VLV16_13070 [Gemmatimonadales bacterium]|nr:hypothetical protein [Gemmatimonadales bacterium]